MEATKQLVQAVRAPIPAAPGRPGAIAYEDERNGTGNLFMMFEPWAGRREVLVTERRTAADYAQAIRHRVDVCYPSAAKIVRVQDNLHTHQLASLDEAFPPDEARRLIDKLEVHYPPTPGSWRNMAEIELGVRSALPSEVAAWQRDRNAEQVQVDWQFTTADARIKLKRLYPILEPVKTKQVDH